MLTPEQRQRTERIHARQIAMRKSGKRLVPLAIDLPDIINSSTEFIEEWVPSKYVINDLRMYSGIPYRCAQGHDSTPNPGWTPDTVPALWTQYHGTSIESARLWRKPSGSHDLYKSNPAEYMIFTDGWIYKCKQDTDHSPTEYAPAWEKVQKFEESAIEPDPTEPEQPTEPEPVVDEWPTWKPWTSGKNEDLYAVGDKVTHKGKHWISTTPNNHYEPGVYGWKEQP